MGGYLLMSSKELKRKSILDLVKSGHISLTTAAPKMGLCYRQTLRIYKRYTSDGDIGLIHRNRGRKPNKAYPEKFREKVIKRYRERYKQFNLGPTLAAEKLAEDGLVVHHETLRRWLLQSGDWIKTRRSKIHRNRRERRKHFGELIQMDGSFHKWHVDGNETMCLMNMVDDATGKTMAHMSYQETTEAAMLLLWRWINKYGVPTALYTDRKNVYVSSREQTPEEILEDIMPKTAFGKACDKLGIEIIAANSPQAKGRVERSNGTYQDRLVKELALRRITTRKTTDKLLKNEFCDDLNTKFAVEPFSKQDFHRPVSANIDLTDVFCIESKRLVRNNWTVSNKGCCYQILKSNKVLPKPGAKIIVRTKLDGSIHFLHRNHELDCKEIKKTELKERLQQKSLEQYGIKKIGNKGHKPAQNHPWRT